MNQHHQISDLLPLYVSGTLGREQHLAVEAHLAICGECQADLALWQRMAQEIGVEDRAVAAPPRRLVDQALAQVRKERPEAHLAQGGVSQAAQWRPAGWLQPAIQMLRAQTPLVKREIWPASAAVMGLGCIAGLVAAHSGFVYALAPLTAATCVALIYGPENDPAYELALSTPTSPRQILLARLALVYGYNLALALVTLLGLLPVLQPSLSQLLWGDLLLAWLAPMTFLSALALALSVWIGASNAIGVAYAAWLVRLLALPLESPGVGLRLSTALQGWLRIYQAFWQTPALLLALSGLLVVMAIWLSGQARIRQYRLS